MYHVLAVVVLLAFPDHTSLVATNQKWETKDECLKHLQPALDNLEQSLISNFGPVKVKGTCASEQEIDDITNPKQPV